MRLPIWDESNAGAEFDKDQPDVYRYVLWRHWRGVPSDCVTFVLLNPSTATATEDDPTIRRCIRFAYDWGYGGIRILNLFALRSTDPKALYSHHDPIGPLNNGWLKFYLSDAKLAVAGWGVHGALQRRGLIIHQRFPQLRTFGLTKDGHPKHPLYLPTTAMHQEWPQSTS